MIRIIILSICLFFLALQIKGQDLEKLKLRIDNELITNLDSVKSGQSIFSNINAAVRFTESYIMEKIGRDNFLNNYKFDSTFNEVFWVSEENGNYSKYSKGIKSDDRYSTPIEEYSEKLRLIYHYNFSYENIQYPTRGFHLHVQLTGDKSAINVQGLISLTKERNLTNILTRDEVLKKIQKSKFKKSEFKKEVRKSLKKNLSINQIAFDYDQFKGEPFEKIFYSILLRDIKEPAYYKFDPWTGKLSCIEKTKIN
jgi:hypothetical protein